MRGSRAAITANGMATAASAARPSPHRPPPSVGAGSCHADVYTDSPFAHRNRSQARARKPGAKRSASTQDLEHAVPDSDDECAADVGRWAGVRVPARALYHPSAVMGTHANNSRGRRDVLVAPARSAIHSGSWQLSPTPPSPTPCTVCTLELCCSLTNVLAMFYSTQTPKTRSESAKN